jgi:hypothetical protein
VLYTENLIFGAYPSTEGARHLYDIQSINYRRGRGAPDLNSEEKNLLERHKQTPTKVYFLPGTYRS